MAENGKILVVDDEPRNVKLLSAHLTSVGYTPVPAFNGEEALKLAVEQQPDVILLDVMMPGLDGFAVIKLLRENTDTCFIPIVLVTSLDGTENKVKGLNTGADEFLTKPIHRTELLARVKGLQHIKLMQQELINRQKIAQSLLIEGDAQPDSEPVVLIVEDDQKLSKQITDVLKVNGFKSVVAESAVAARDYVCETLPDIVLLDRLLAESDGLELISEWKREPLYSDMPVIVITSLDDLQQKVEGIDLGADDYLIKPLEHTELVARVRASMRRLRAQQKLKMTITTLFNTSITDELTGLYNEHYLLQDMTHRTAASIRAKSASYTLVLLEIKQFDQIVDVHGRMIADGILAKFAKNVQSLARASDIIARVEQANFGVIMPNQDEVDAQRLIERIKNKMKSMAEDDKQGLQLDIIYTIDQWQEHDTEFSDTLNRAKQELVKQKHLELAGNEAIIKDLISTVSHELRAPLTSIKGAIGLLLSGTIGDLPPAAQDMLEVANRSSGRLNNMLDDLLDIHKMETGKLELEKANCDLNNVAIQGIENCKFYEEERGVNIRLDKSTEPVNVYADEKRLVQVVTNLLSNAIKYSPDNGVVNLSVVSDGGNAVLTVKDSGPGIPDEFKSQIFTRFTQAKNSKPGSGLGLCVVKTIIDNHQGEIEFANNPEGGATFWVTLAKA